MSSVFKLPLCTNFIALPGNGAVHMSNSERDIFAKKILVNRESQGKNDDYFFIVRPHFCIPSELTCYYTKNENDFNTFQKVM